MIFALNDGVADDNYDDFVGAALIAESACKNPAFIAPPATPIPAASPKSHFSILGCGLLAPPLRRPNTKAPTRDENCPKNRLLTKVALAYII